MAPQLEKTSLKAQQMSQLRAKLLRRRRKLLETSQLAQVEASGLKELRESEYEEVAQVEAAHYALSHQLESQRRELLKIDTALQRMEEGVFGQCIECEQDIPFERLSALPYTLFCEEDASRREASERGSAPYSSL